MPDEAANSQITAATKKSFGTPFEKGKSGNPNGRPKLLPHFQEQCRKHSPAALQRLVDGLSDKGPGGVKSAELILAYGWGKPTIIVEGSVQGGVTILLDTGIRRLEEPEEDVE